MLASKEERKRTLKRDTTIENFGLYLHLLQKRQKQYPSTKLIPIPTTKEGWDKLRDVIVELEIKLGMLDTEFFDCASRLCGGHRYVGRATGSTIDGKPLCKCCTKDMNWRTALLDPIHFKDPRSTIRPRCHKQNLNRRDVSGGEHLLKQTKKTEDLSQVTCALCIKILGSDDARARREKEREALREEERKIAQSQRDKLLELARAKAVPQEGARRVELAAMSRQDLQALCSKLGVGNTRYLEKEALVDRAVSAEITKGELVEGDAFCKVCGDVIFFIEVIPAGLPNFNATARVTDRQAAFLLFNALSVCASCIYGLAKWSGFYSRMAMICDEAITEGVIPKKQKPEEPILTITEK